LPLDGTSSKGISILAYLPTTGVLNPVDFLNPSTQYWFAVVSASKVQWKYALTCAVVLSCFAGYDSSIGDWLILSRIIVYYPFFLIGYLIDPNKLGEIVKKTSIKVMSGIWLMVITVLFLSNGEKLYWLRPLLTGRNPYSKLELFSEMGGAVKIYILFCSYNNNICYCCNCS